MKKQIFLTAGGWFFIAVGVFLFAIPIIIPVLLDQISSKSWYGWLALVLFLFGLTLSVIDSYAKENRLKNRLQAQKEQLKEQEKALVELTVQLVLQMAIKDVALSARTRARKTSFSSDVHLRANIMLIDSSNNLYVAHHINMDNQEEINLKWPKGHGCCGLCWDDRKQIIVDPTKASGKNLPDWRRYPTSSHKTLTAPIKSICSTPVFHPSTKEIIGVLNVDSKKPLTDTKLDNPTIYKDLQRKAVFIASLLIR